MPTQGMTVTGTTTAPNYTTWNGATCPTCNARYTGHHACSSTDILRRIGELHALLAQLSTCRPVDRMAGCPCRQANGGSGVCGCILGGLTVT